MKRKLFLSLAAVATIFGLNGASFAQTKHDKGVKFGAPIRFSGERTPAEIAKELESRVASL